jgi:hypothetical protein
MSYPTAIHCSVLILTGQEVSSGNVYAELRLRSGVAATRKHGC